MAGKPGRYISMEKGLMVESVPKIRMITKYCRLVINLNRFRNGYIPESRKKRLYGFIRASKRAEPFSVTIVRVLYKADQGNFFFSAGPKPIKT
jgi:hypothetical protein